LLEDWRRWDSRCSGVGAGNWGFLVRTTEAEELLRGFTWSCSEGLERALQMPLGFTKISWLHGVIF
jgi:hypothetical protein